MLGLASSHFKHHVSAMRSSGNAGNGFSVVVFLSLEHFVQFNVRTIQLAHNYALVLIVEGISFLHDLNELGVCEAFIGDAAGFLRLTS